MIAMRIADTKDFMQKLLIGHVFDKFYFCEGTAETFMTFRFGGRLHKGYYTAQEQELLMQREYACWYEVRPFVYQILKGKKLPVRFQLVFALSRENVEWLMEHQKTGMVPEQIEGLYLNIKYENQMVTCVTGTSLSIFTLDKTVEQVWDAAALQYLRQNAIAVSDD